VLALAALMVGAKVPLGETVGAITAGVIMALVSGGGGKSADETRKTLDEMKKLLTHIESELQDLRNQLTSLEQQLAISTSDIERTVLTSGMDPYVTHINQLWDQYLAIGRPDGTYDGTHLASLSAAILDSNNGAFAQLVGIHDGLTGEGGVSGSTLHAVADNAAIHAASGSEEDVMSYYMVLEDYFGALTQAQTRGATLMTEALRYREATVGAPAQVGDYPGTAEYFMDGFSAHIGDQVEHYLS